MFNDSFFLYDFLLRYKMQVSYLHGFHCPLVSLGWGGSSRTNKTKTLNYLTALECFFKRDLSFNNKVSVARVKK